MIQTNAFDYINVLNRAADAAWQRNEAISNNIANVDTPGYKRQDVAFESVLQQALGNNRYQSMDDKVADSAAGRMWIMPIIPTAWTAIMWISRMKM